MATTRPKVLITGANGLIGSLTRRGLGDRYEFSGLSRHAVEGIPYTVASITDLDAVRGAVAGMDMVLHLAGETRNDDDWDDHFGVTAGGTVNVFRASAEAGVKRVVYMSSGSTMCGWEWDDSLPYGKLARGEWDAVDTWELLDDRTPPRPDSPYGTAKLFGEAVARWFSDRTPMCTLTLRIWLELYVTPFAVNGRFSTAAGLYVPSTRSYDSSRSSMTPASACGRFILSWRINRGTGGSSSWMSTRT